MSAAKKVAHAVIDRKLENGRIHGTYKLMEELIGLHHKRVADAKIAIAWCYTWKQDKDGNLKLYDVKRASEIDRQLHSYDFVILLNDGTWNHSEFTEAQRRALMDEALCAMDVSVDSDGEERVDENGRTVYTKRSPDIVAFSECVARNGIWTHELEKLAGIMADQKERPLLGSPLRKEEPAEDATEAAPAKPAGGDGASAHESMAGRQVKLLKDIHGFNSAGQGLLKGKVFAAEPGSNGEAVVRALTGARVKLESDQFEYLPAG